MPKRANIDDRRKRQKDKMRKRQKREQMACSSDDTTAHDTAKSVVSCGSTDGAVSNGLFYTFDSHSRSTRGLFSVNGKSTRLLFESVQDLLEHIQNLATSMGFSNIVECNITGARCRANSLEQQISNNRIAGNQTEKNRCDNSTDFSVVDNHDNDDLMFLHCEGHRFQFCPMSEALKLECCNELGLPYFQKDENTIEMHTRELGRPSFFEQEYHWRWQLFFQSSFLLSNLFRKSPSKCSKCYL